MNCLWQSFFWWFHQYIKDNKENLFFLLIFYVFVSIEIVKNVTAEFAIPKDFWFGH